MSNAPANTTELRRVRFRYRERPKQKRGKAMSFRLSEAEHAELKQRAADVGTSMEDLVRRLVFKKEAMDQK